MFRFSVFALLCLAATPAFAQTQPAPATPPAAQAPAGPPPEIMNALQQAGTAYGQCVSAGVPTVPATVTPEAGAANVLSGCAAQRRTLDQAVAALLAAIPEAQRPMVQERIGGQLGAVEGQVIAGIRAMRAPTPPAATPAPTPAH